MAYKQSPKSPALKALIGKQKNLPEALKQKILESGEKASMAKQLGVDPVETAKFEASKAVEMKFDDKIEKAGGIGEVDPKTGQSLNPKVRRLEKRSVRKQKRKANRAGKKAAKSVAKQTEGLRNISKGMEGMQDLKKELTPEEKRKELAKKKAAQKRKKSTTGPKSKNIKITPKKGSGKPEKVDKKPIKKPIEGGIIAKPISEKAIKVKK